MTRRLPRLALVALAAATLPLAACSSDAAPATTSPAADSVAAGSNETAAVILIDVRNPDEYAAGHLDGAVNYSYELGTLEASLADLDPSATYQVYCHSGRRSALATELLTSNGFTHVTDLGGIEQAAATTGLSVVV